MNPEIFHFFYLNVNRIKYKDKIRFIQTIWHKLSIQMIFCNLLSNLHFRYLITITISIEQVSIIHKIQLILWFLQQFFIYSIKDLQEELFVPIECCFYTKIYVLYDSRIKFKQKCLCYNLQCNKPIYAIFSMNIFLAIAHNLHIRLA